MTLLSNQKYNYCRISEKLSKFEELIFVFALIYCDINTNRKFQINNVFCKIRDIKNFNNIFDFKNATILLKYEDKNYKTDFIFEKELFYRLL